MHGAIAVRSQNPDAGCFEPLEQLRIGMAVRIVLASTDHGDARMHRSQKCRHRRVFASVMADFEHVGT
jgi:hypothetical protein